LKVYLGLLKTDEVLFKLRDFLLRNVRLRTLYKETIVEVI